MTAHADRAPLHTGRAIRLLPGIVVTGYLTATVLLFAFGPWPWPIADGRALYWFLTGAHLTFLLGYLSSSFASARPYGFGITPQALLKSSLAVSLLLLLPTAAARTGSFLPNVAAGVADPGSAYNLSQAVRAAGPMVGVEYLRILFAPLIVPAIPLTLYYWPSLSLATRVTGAVLIAGFLSIFVAMGTNKAIADTILITPWLIVAGHFGGFWRLRLRGVLMATTALAMALLFFFWFFTSGQLTRDGQGTSTGYFSTIGTFADQHHPLVRWLPARPKAGAISLIRYVSHGYYGLYLAQQEPFVPTYGAGHSLFLQRSVAKLTRNPALISRPYPMRAEHRGWSALGLWSSIYPWLASDLTFPGVLLATFLIGRLFAQSWIDALAGDNPFAIVAFSLLTVMVFYFPANNQMMQDGEPLVGFVFTIALWQLSRRRRGSHAG